MSYVDVLKNQIEDALKESDKDLGWLEQVAPGIIKDAVRLYVKVMMPIPWVDDEIADHISGPLISRLESAVAELRKGIEFVEPLIAYVGSPDSLRAAAQVIGDRIVSPAQALAPTVNLSRLRSGLPEYWNDGDASVGYEHAVDGRQDAVNNIVTFANPLASGLGAMADEIENFYLALVAAVVGLAVAIGGAVAACMALSGVVTAPAAIVAAIVAVVGCITAVIAIFQLVVGTQQAMASIQGDLSGAIPVWPKALT